MGDVSSLLLKVVGTLAVVGFVHPSYWWLAGAVAVGWFGYRGYLIAAAEWREDLTEKQQLIADADRQHAQVLAGDERGVYGHYPPAA
jgi:hypothetical protein